MGALTWTCGGRRRLALTAVVFIQLLFAPRADAKDADTLKYTIVDDFPAGSLVGNVAKDAKLSRKYSAETLGRLQFMFLSQGVHTEYFTVNEASGQLSSVANVDRDVICAQQVECVIRVDVVIQPREFLRIIHVLVNVTDKNDHAPQFPLDQVELDISESAGLGRIANIQTARDPDSPRFGVTNYRLDNTLKGLFSLDVTNSTGHLEISLVLNDYLDREQKDSYELKVIAEDGGDPPLKSSMLLDLNVLDENDNNPRFYSSTHEVNVPENLNKGVEISQIEATDADAGLNGRITYSFSDDTVADVHGTFVINAQTGGITLKKPLDYEKRDFYSLVIIAKDKGPNSLPANSRLLVKVVDINDNIPTISLSNLPKDGVARIKENEPINFFVAHVLVDDPDSGDNGRVDCFMSGGDGMFEILDLHEKEFKIVTGRSLDREEKAEYILHLHCKDYGLPRYSAEISFKVQVIDVNDNPPSFTQSSYRIPILENNRVGMTVVQLTAIDEDLGPGGHVTFLPGSKLDGFELDPQTGVIKLVTSLDREKTHEARLKILARDNGKPSLTSTATVIIDVLDEDDQMPRFTHPSFTMRAKENEEPRTVVGKVHAIDADAPPHNTFHFYIDASKSNTNAFSIDPITGAVFTKIRLDREEMDTYHLTVLVQSDQSPNNMDTAVVTIYVEDANDNRPTFLFPTEENNVVMLSPLSPLGYRAATLRAHDLDIGNHSKLSYAIVNSDAPGFFELNSYSGEIRLKQNLEMYPTGQIKLQVRVADQGVPPLQSFQTLFVKLNYSAAIRLEDMRTSYQSKADGGRGNSVKTTYILIIGCVCGLLVVLLSCCVIIVFLRRGKRGGFSRTPKPWLFKPPPTPTKLDLVKNESNEHQYGTSNGTTDRIPIRQSPQSPVVENRDPYQFTTSEEADPGVTNQFGDIALQKIKPAHKNDVKDTTRKAKCADGSNSSKDEPRRQQGSATAPPCPQSPKKSTPHDHKALQNNSNQVALPPQRAHPPSFYQAYPEYKRGFAASNQTFGRVDPSHHTLGPSFSEWLLSEKSQLQSQGQRYHVSENEFPAGYGTLPSRKPNSRYEAPGLPNGHATMHPSTKNGGGHYSSSWYTNSHRQRPPGSSKLNSSQSDCDILNAEHRDIPHRANVAPPQGPNSRSRPNYERQGSRPDRIDDVKHYPNNSVRQPSNIGSFV